MPKKSEQIAKRIETLYCLAYDTDCTVDLVNGKTHETITLDKYAIKAGFLAGLAAAGSIVDDVSAGDSTRIAECYKQAILAAGKAYVEMTLDESGVVDHG
ncbi:hypothetical protein [Olsenella sp. Marseille-P4559]|uniref:hypothetical protein n=1 Tax=Olsenella sp. Marseille-P4559 TaxID=2364795 RepID=UPI0010320E44|nr:hypothetical protein [Olsenella sp. Marseille-P4559]